MMFHVFAIVFPTDRDREAEARGLQSVTTSPNAPKSHTHTGPLNFIKLIWGMIISVRSESLPQNLNIHAEARRRIRAGCQEQKSWMENIRSVSCEINLF